MYERHHCTLRTPNARKDTSPSIWVFFHEDSRFTGQEGKGEPISSELLRTTIGLKIDLHHFPAGLYLFKVNNRGIRKKCQS